MTELQIIIALLVILSLGATIGFLLSKLIGKSDSELPVDQQKESMKAAFVELARDEIEKIHETFEQNQKLEDKDKDKLNKDFKGGDIHLDSIFPSGSGNTTWTSETRGSEAQIIFYINGLPYWYAKDDKTVSHSVRLIRRD